MLEKSFCFALFLVLVPCIASADSVTIPGLVTIKAGTVETPPDWAIAERNLIETMETNAAYYLDKFTRDDGTLYGRGEYDDLYEMFFNWPLFYAIGAKDQFLEWALTEYKAITVQSTPSYLYKGFPRCDDWFHISEGMMAFYDFGVGDPTIQENIERAKTFAGFYMNEDTESSANFDPVHKVITSIATGSKGPTATYSGATYMINYGHADLYPIVKDLESNWEADAERKKEILYIFNTIVTPCDAPVNLAVTGLMTNAYLYTGEEKYKTWVLDYVDAWMKYVEENNGILPDNIGRTGKIGEYREDQWWGGFFGWTGRYSIHMIFSSLCVASECAYMLSGDPKYLDLLRSQIDVLLDNSVIEKEQLLVPYKHGPDGWNSYRPFRIFDLAHLWQESMAEEDWKRIERVREGHKFYPLGYSGQWGENMYNELDTKQYEPGAAFDWKYVPSSGDRDIDFPTEYARLMYYAGENPDWPKKIIEADLQESQRRYNFMLNDKRNISTMDADDLYPNNPVITKGLVQVTMGTPQTVYNGGLLRARVRYFDLDRACPGLPPDVAALVDKLEADLTGVYLVNLSETETRKLIIQAGAFGEHEFTEVRYMGNSDEKSIIINKKYFAVELPPATSIHLNIGTRRFVNDPSYAFPWHETETMVKKNENNPLTLCIKGTYPNPFNMETTIEYEIPSGHREVFIDLSIYSITGQKVCTLVLKRNSPGMYSAKWNGIDEKGRIVSNGIYFALLRNEASISVKKIVLLK